MAKLLTMHKALMLLFVGLSLAVVTYSSELHNDFAACLPHDVKQEETVSSRNSSTAAGASVKALTVRQTLLKLKARCKKDRLVDGTGREIYFYRLIGCWGNPPANYEELLQKQERELQRLKKKYTVMEIPCTGLRDLRQVS